MKNDVDEFLSYLDSIRQDCKYTLKLYKYDINQFLKLSSIPFTYKNYLQLLKFYETKQYSLNTITRKLIVIKEYLNFIYKKYKYEQDLKFIQIHKIKMSIPRTIKEEEFYTFIEKFTNKNYYEIITKNMIIVLYATGLRISELISITLDKIFLDKKEIKIIGKNDKERIVFITDYCKINLSDFLNIRLNRLKNKKNNFLFTVKGCKHISRSFAFSLIKRYCEKYELPLKVYPHLFRHSYASLMVEKGVDLLSLKELMGHSSVDVTQIYVHSDEPDEREQFENSFKI